MIAFAVAVAVIVVILIAPLLLPVYRRHRVAAELRGDWWPRFEQDLQQYTSNTWRSAREAERHV